MQDFRKTLPDFTENNLKRNITEVETKSIKSTLPIFDRRAHHGGLRAIISPDDYKGFRNKYLDIMINNLVISQLPPTCSKILDFGCGNGRLVEALAETSAEEITGVDISKNMLKYARKKDYGKTKVRFKKIPPTPPCKLKKNFYDAVTCTWVFQHIGDDQVVGQILRQLYRSIIPGGIVIIFDRISTKRFYDFFGEQFFLVVRTPEEEIQLAQTAGFELARQKFVHTKDKFWQKFLSKDLLPFWEKLIPFMVWWDMNLSSHKPPVQEERVECLFVFRKP
ncbi:MAG: class I SAM-dependent methyltransferase [Vulcanimicrobiota bacterium]